ncbi:MAG: bifunctional phosphoglucose/phosphomannose isomerase [Candidatus Firestonebacteria bacterium RIFOXYC2_FULL_39_67]|nr:MAG: bifunctional phosphoglucose/phosphomannose isomerase [Candidatus Firestonebacteria bacterium RIFOXYD2_FULL_39_29]OGF53378.1 MAG: bifunctional phosphoglucose/phosphomannose isomerase [Candidatus Firestonebacteria bacterium RIFOXYC2_FULL_39_67]OGF57911.1 MAG: bifunctional phosphoglucose/phosphomannose isomerase [Candidatus Firestonebacteria bacterium RifOxyC12_full_39_7]
MFDLDYLKGMKKLDPSSMMENVLNFPEMVKTGIRIGKDAKVPLDYKNASKVLFTGLGGSAIGGDILKNLLYDNSSVSITVNRNYTVPKWVGEDTLVFAVSHSGNTEETISAFKDALSKKAKIIVITSGGALKILAKENKIPVILVPGEKPPRASLPYLFFPVLIIMYKLGFAKVKTGELSELLKILEMLKKTYAPEVKLEDNPAKKLASKLFAKPVIIFGSADSTDAVATRWKCQLSENSKVITFACTIPEMNHNEIVSWGMLKKILRKFAVLFIRDEYELPQIKKRFKLTKEVISKRANWSSEICSVGNCMLVRMFSLIYLGDFTSVYLAILYKEDPTAIKIIEEFKNALSE